MRQLLPAQGMVNWLVMHTSCREAINDHIAYWTARYAKTGIVPRTPVFFGKRRERPAFLI
jgi:hypothetical protein